MKNYFYKRTLKLSVLIVLMFFFSCSKDLDAPIPSLTNNLEKTSVQFGPYNNFIDPDILLSLKQDALFQEYVLFLDCSYINHLTDSLKITTINEFEFNTQYLNIMSKRSGSLKELLNEVIDHYPKDFLRYVIYESSLKINGSNTRSIDIDDVIIDSSDKVYSMMADCYHRMYSAFLSLAHRSFTEYRSKIKTCDRNEYLDHDWFITAAMNALGFSEAELYNTQGLSDNFRRHVTVADIRLAIDREQMERISVRELREITNYCVGLMEGMLAWNPYYEIAFVSLMSCEYGHNDGGGGGTTNPPTDPEPPVCPSDKCNSCGGCLNSNCSFCSDKCDCTCADAKCPVCKFCISARIASTRSANYCLPCICAYNPQESLLDCVLTSIHYVTALVGMNITKDQIRNLFPHIDFNKGLYANDIIDIMNTIFNNTSQSIATGNRDDMRMLLDENKVLITNYPVQTENGRYGHAVVVTGYINTGLDVIYTCLDPRTGQYTYKSSEELKWKFNGNDSVNKFLVTVPALNNNQYK